LVETSDQYIRFAKRVCTSHASRNKSVALHQKIFSPACRLVYGFHTIEALPGKFVDATGVSLRV
jgi:hypothetical protein